MKAPSFSFGEAFRFLRAVSWLKQRSIGLSSPEPRGAGNRRPKFSAAAARRFCGCCPFPGRAAVSSVSEALRVDLSCPLSFPPCPIKRQGLRPGPLQERHLPERVLQPSACLQGLHLQSKREGERRSGCDGPPRGSGFVCRACMKGDGESLAERKGPEK